MRVLLTGATGFLGRALARRLAESGYAVVALVRRREDAPDTPGVEPAIGDITSLESVVAAAAGCGAVVHCAARVAMPGGLEEDYEVNVVGTDHVLAACEVGGIARLVFTSCAGIALDGRASGVVDETRPLPDRAATPYLATKALAERRVLAANGSELATVALRPHLLWGPGEPHLLPEIVARAKSGSLRLFGDPGAAIDSCYVDNAVDAHLEALERLEPGGTIAGKAYFVTQGEPTSVDGFFNALLHAAGFPAETRRASAARTRASSIVAPLGRAATGRAPLISADTLAVFGRSAVFDIADARRDLGYAPRVGTTEGLARVSAHLARERMRRR
ncbi:MAG TPA: NAD-dependent epimerase/dehydratase family protein [Rhodanobacteraceae bacterium]|nr:NAD-dependent epimerase/dehydratase family protein [Rhodanobacteraceae bacterium]